MDVFSDLEAEHAQLDAMLQTLSAEQWGSPSNAAGWTIADVVLHLAQTEEYVVGSASASGTATWTDAEDGIDVRVATRVAAERDAQVNVFERWRTASRDAVATLRAADPDVKLRWAAAPLKPTTLATTRIAEHWAHALDIAVPLGVSYPDTDRLHHVAWLGHHTLPYALHSAGVDPQPVRVELTSPGGAPWRFGDPNSSTKIVGTAAEFCRIGARRLKPADSTVVATGPLAAEVLHVLRNYAV